MNRSNNREWFYVPPNLAWSIFTTILNRAALMYCVEVHVFVLMSNHYHLLVSTPLANLDEFMRYFQTEVCREIQRHCYRINHIFGTRYGWSILEDSYALAYVYKYLVRNPVRAGLVSAVQDYRFSSLSSMMEMRPDLALFHGLGLQWRQVPRQPQDLIAWLNIPTPKEVEALIGKGLRRSKFAFSRGNDVRQRLEYLRQNYGVETAPATFSAEK